MSHEVLKELLIAVGFKADESSYKRATTLIANVEKQLVANDKAAKEREASEKSRVANQTLRAAEVASNLRMVGAAVAGFATLAVGALAAVTTAVKNASVSSTASPTSRAARAPRSTTSRPSATPSARQARRQKPRSRP